MKDVATKTIGDKFFTTDANSMASEEENIVLSSGQVLSEADSYQLSKGISNYVAAGDFYTDSGVANAYVLTSINSFKSPTTYVNGLRCRFIPAFSNTGASTINVATLGIKNIKDPGGNDLVANEMPAGGIVELFYNGTNFVLFHSSSFSIPFSDALAIIANSADPTKLIGFDASNIATTTRKNIIMPNRDVNLAFSILQQVDVFDNAHASTATIIPEDNTIPTNTEGGEFMTLSITPLRADSFLKVNVVFFGATQSVPPVNFFVALFRDSASNAIAVGAGGGDQNVIQTVNFSFIVPSVATSLTIFKVRAGASSGGLDFNGAAGNPLMGGTAASSIIITEYIY